MTQEFEPRIDLTEVQQAVEAIASEVKKVIIGQDNMIDLLIVALLSDQHVLIEGVPGIAKTLTARLIAKTIKTGFSRIQFTPDLMPSDVTGTSVWNAQSSEFEFKAGPIFSNMILLDEINRAPAKTQSALFEVMEERQVTVDGITRQIAAPFMVLATQNPIEHEGTYRLPEAQLDRFMFKIFVDYPSLEDETRILQAFDTRGDQTELEEVQPVVEAERIASYQRLIKQVHTEPHLIEYITNIIHQSRHHGALYLGASPRASLAILSASKSLAAMSGRDFITPDDIQTVTHPVLRHRLLLTPEKEMEGVTPDDIISNIIEQIEVPR